MAIQGQQNLNFSGTGEDLASAFNKTQQNFTTLFNTASPYVTFSPVNYTDILARQYDPQSNGIAVVANSTTGTVLFMNTGVTSITAGSGILLSSNKGDITISSTGSGSGGISSIGITTTTLSVSGSPLIASGTIGLDLPIISGSLAGTYTSPTMTIDKYGRVIHASNNSIAGTVSNVVVEGGSGINVTGGPITTTGTITVTNTGVTQLNAGPGISLSGSNGVVTVAATGGSGTVSQVSLRSNNLTITGSPITSIGTLTVDVPDSPIFTGNTSVTRIQVTNSSANALSVTGGANVLGDLYVGGNLHVPNLISTNSTTLDVTDPLLYLSASTPGTYNYDIGFYSHFGSGGGYQHTGLVRDHVNSKWYLFSNAAEPAGGTVDLANANLILDTLVLGNVISLNANLGNLVTANYVNVNIDLDVSGNAGIDGFIVVDGNITSANAKLGNLVTANYYTGTLTTGAQPNITSVGTLGNLVVTSNVTSSNANITTLLTATTANITGNINVGNANITTNLKVGNITTTNGIFWANGAPYSPPAPNLLMASISANIAIATTSAVSLPYNDLSYSGNVLVYNNVIVDTETGYTTTNGKYTPTVAGYYQIEASFAPYVVSLSTVGDGSNYFIVLVKNGNTIVGVGNEVGGSGLVTGSVAGITGLGFTQSSINTIVNMNGSTDYLQIFLVAKINSGSYTNGTTLANYLQAIWLRP